MKKLMLFLAVLVGFSTLANAATRGYLYKNRGGDLYFDGLNDLGQRGDGFQIDFALRMSSLSQQQLDLMNACMKEKQTHAIQVVSTVKAVSIPSGVAGRNTKFHKPTYEVACVSAPGFLGVWRNEMGAE